MKLYVYTDGASRGNPGESASGFRVLDSSNRLLHKEVFYNGICTNNVAEYKAIIAALKSVRKLYKNAELVLHSDSELVINQLTGNYKIKDAKLKVLNKEAKALLKKLGKYELLNVRRENRQVSAVDKELNDFLDDKE